jgi:4-nitrophenyl phosphatase
LPLTEDGDPGRARSIGNVDGLAVDLDGVIYRGDVAIPGAAAKIEDLRARGVGVVFCTNNSRSTVAGYEAKLGGLGIEVDPSEVVTSAVVTGEFLRMRDRYRSAFVIGGPGLEEAVDKAGIARRDRRAGEEADLVVVGWDPEFTYADLRVATHALLSGAGFVASNADATFPAERGRLVPGAGPIVAALEFATGRRAEVMGKPNRPMMDLVAARLAPAQRIALVGDRPDTDLAGARAMGWRSVLVLSGVTTREEAERLDPPPDLIIESVAELEL